MTQDVQADLLKRVGELECRLNMLTSQASVRGTHWAALVEEGRSSDGSTKIVSYRFSPGYEHIDSPVHIRSMSLAVHSSGYYELDMELLHAGDNSDNLWFTHCKFMTAAHQFVGNMIPGSWSQITDPSGNGRFNVPDEWRTFRRPDWCPIGNTSSLLLANFDTLTAPGNVFWVLVDRHDA